MKLSFQICLCIVIVLNAYTLNAQDNNADSLINKLQNQKEDTLKAKLIMEISNFYLAKKDYKKCLIYANQAKQLSQNLSFKKTEADAFYNVGIVEMHSGNDNESKLNFTNALQLYTTLHLKEPVANCYNMLGVIAGNADNRTEAIKDSYIALRIYEEINNTKQRQICLCMIGFNEYGQKDYDEAKLSFLKVIDLFKITKDNYTGSISYIFLADIYRIQKQFTKALYYDSVGMNLACEFGDMQIIADGYFFKGEILSRPFESSAKEDLINPPVSLPLALANYYKSLINFKSVKDSGGMGDNYSCIANVYIRQNKYNYAALNIDSAFLCANAVQFKDNFAQAFLQKHLLDSATGKFKSALEDYKKYIIYRDSNANEESRKKLIEETMQYDFDAKEAAAKSAQQIKDANNRRIKNQQYFAIASLAIMVFAILIIALIQLRNNKNRQKANAIITKQKEQVEYTLTELKATQHQLIQSEKMASLGELTAGIAHEIQNPLNFVNNFSEVNKELLEELKDEADKGNIEEIKAIANDVIENSEKINHHGKRADSIVKGMLQHSRLRTGQKELTDINALADEYLRLAYHGLRAKDNSFNASVNTDFDETINKINFIPQDIGRVLLNLYTNAFYAVSEKKKQQPEGYEPTVSVTTKKINNNVEIKVSDNGNGIPSNIINKIFQPFFTTKPTGQGTGLGLSLSYDIIKACEGEIKVNTKESEGTTFIIKLPSASYI